MAGFSAPSLHSPLTAPPGPHRGEMETNVWREANSKVSCLEEAVATSEETNRGGERERGREGEEDGEGERRQTDTSRPQGLGHRVQGGGPWGHSRQQSPLSYGPGFSLSCFCSP